MEDVAGRVQVSQVMLYNSFSTKEEPHLRGQDQGARSGGAGEAHGLDAGAAALLR
jgi:hypothetical protein